MNTINTAQALTDSSLNRQSQGLTRTTDATLSQPDRVRDAFTQFVGETFYAQMLKAMRSSLGKPAYFHGGRAEEVFTSQLHQTLAEELADTSTESFVEPMFRQQFPQLAAQQQQAKQTGSAPAGEPLAPLDLLRRR